MDDNGTSSRRGAYVPPTVEPLGSVSELVMGAPPGDFADMALADGPNTIDVS